MVWQEHQDDRAHIRYRFGGQANWTPFEVISDQARDARQPAIAVTQSSQVSAVWQDGTSFIYRRRFAGSEDWDAPQPLVSNPQGLGEPAMAGSLNGEINLVWNGWVNTSERDIFVSKREPLVRPKMFFPVIVKR